MKCSRRLNYSEAGGDLILSWSPSPGLLTVARNKLDAVWFDDNNFRLVTLLHRQLKVISRVLASHVSRARQLRKGVVNVPP